MYSNYANNSIIVEMPVKVDSDMLFTYLKNFFLFVFKELLDFTESQNQPPWETNKQNPFSVIHLGCISH